MSAPHTMHKVLKSKALEGLMLQSRALLQAQEQIRALLPADWRARVSVAVLDARTLTVVVPDAALGLRLRFQAAKMLAAVAPLAPASGRSLRIAVSPATAPPEPRERRARQPGLPAAVTVQAAARHTPYEPLQAALERLGKTLESAAAAQAGTASGRK